VLTFWDDHYLTTVNGNNGAVCELFDGSSGGNSDDYHDSVLKRTVHEYYDYYYYLHAAIAITAGGYGSAALHSGSGVELRRTKSVVRETTRWARKQPPVPRRDSLDLLTTQLNAAKRKESTERPEAGN